MEQEKAKKKRGAPNKPKHRRKVQQNFKLSPAVIAWLRGQRVKHGPAEIKGAVTMSKMVELAVVKWYSIQQYVDEYNKREAAK